MKRFIILCFTLFFIVFVISLNKRINFRKTYFQEKSAVSLPVKQEDSKQELTKEEIAKSKKELAAILKKVKRKHDSFEERTIYESWNSVENWKDDCYLRLVHYKDNCYLGWTTVYYSDDWLFVKSFSVKADNKKYDVYPSYYEDINRTNSSNSVWESISLPYKGNEDVIKSIANSKAVTIRFYGDKYYADRKLSRAKINAIKDMLSLYDLCQKGMLENK